MVTRSDGYASIRTAIISSVGSNATVVSSFNTKEPVLPCVVIPTLDFNSTNVTIGTKFQETITITIEAFVTTESGQGGNRLATILDGVTTAFKTLNISGLAIEELRPISLSRFDLNEQTVLTAGIEVELSVM